MPLSIVITDTEIDYTDYINDDDSGVEIRTGSAYEIGDDFDNDCF